MVIWAPAASIRGVFDGTKEFGDVINAGSLNYFAQTPEGRPRLEAPLRLDEGVDGRIHENHVDPGWSRIHTGHDRQRIRLLLLPSEGGVFPSRSSHSTNTDKVGVGDCSIDNERFDWLVSELDAGEAARRTLDHLLACPDQPL